jgi:hypothetical protein
MRFTEGLRVTLSAEARPHAICHNLPPDQTCLRIHALSFAHVCSASPGCTCRQYTFAAVRGYETGPREDHLRKATTHPGGFPAASVFLGTNPEQPAYLLDSALVLPLRLQRRLQADGLAKVEDANIPSKGTSPTSELLARAVVKWHG